MCRQGTNKVICLLALNGSDEVDRQDLGHVVHSGYQDNDLDREALEAMVRLIFDGTDADTIVTHNTCHEPQLAPLKSLGFERLDAENPGQLALAKDRRVQREK